MPEQRPTPRKVREPTLDERQSRVAGRKPELPGSPGETGNGGPDFYLNYTIKNDGQDHFTGSLNFSGWGQGFIHNFSTEYAYTDTGLMTRDLTRQAYGFIQGGWHDSRPECANGPQASSAAAKRKKR